MSHIPKELQPMADRMKQARERAEQLRAQHPDKTTGQLVIMALREKQP